jgi:hypothetical protein
MHLASHYTVINSLPLVLSPASPQTAKSEASTLLAVKQAAFIRNPEYDGDGSGPDIVTIGHNPFVPNLGLASHVVLNSVGTLGGVLILSLR